MSNAHPTTARIHIFRAGFQRSANGLGRYYSSDDLANCARAYSPAVFAAALVVGHPQDNTPAYGWVDRLEASGDDLFAHVSGIDPLLAAAVSAGLYRRVSASFYLPEASHNPVPGTLYLRHVGLLGAAAPAVKDLQPLPASFIERAARCDGVQFSQNDAQPAPDANCPTLIFSTPPTLEYAQLMSTETTTEAPSQTSAASDPAPTPAPDAAALTRELEQLRTQLAAAQQQVRRAAQQRAADEAAAFCERLSVSGQLTPAQRPGVQAALTALLHDGDATANHSEGAPSRRAAALDLMAALQSLSPQVPLGITSADHSEGRTSAGAVRSLREMSGADALALFRTDRAAFDALVRQG